MFEDQTQPNPPKNLPTEPVDMFAGVESGKEELPPVAPVNPIPDALKAGFLKKKDELSVQTPPDLNSVMPKQETYKMSAPVLGKVLTYVIILLLVAGAGFGGWLIYSYVKNSNQPAPSSLPANSSGDLNSQPAVSQPDNNSQVPAAAIPEQTQTQANNVGSSASTSVDTDKDGLTDAQEVQYGTDINTPDSDADGLSDGDEVLIWHTNPLNPDSDGDGYPDGTEVRNGYSPLGPGKLFNIPAPSSTTGNANTNTPAPVI